jgi:hypothetical protein
MEKITDLRMCEGMVSDGKEKTGIDEVARKYGNAVAYLLSKNGSVRIVEDPYATIKRAIHLT